jgi:hypothetical protein
LAGDCGERAASMLPDDQAETAAKAHPAAINVRCIRRDFIISSYAGRP